ncbi:hypothetical protein [Hyphomicrobium sp.]|uniref:hypothetical protein n=1 Tax=Hyphomicrobium sp. TaxID=82 RepID=UPI003F70E8CA
MSKPSDPRGQVAADHMGDSFLRIAKYFREIQDNAPEQFAEIAKLVGVSLRRAYYYAKIDRAFSSLDIDENRLAFIGWTKLKVIADHVDGSNFQLLLDLAQASTVRELKILMQDGVPVDGTRCVILYMEPLEYEVFEQALLASGASKAGRGLIDKEAALVKALTKHVGA